MSALLLFLLMPADCPNLVCVVLALSVTDLADDAFGDSTPIILYQ